MTVIAADYVRLHDSLIEPNPARVVPRLVIPLEDHAGSHARSRELVSRIKQLSSASTEELATALVARFEHNYDDFKGVLIEHAHIIDLILEEHQLRDSFQELLVGAAFTAEFAPEAVAICNPSPLVHPDQSEVPPGSLRIALAGRAIGEGHISSICFFEAVVTEDSWKFQPHHDHLALATIENGQQRHELFNSVLQGYDRKMELAGSVVGEQLAHQTNPSLLNEEVEGFLRWRRHALSRNSKTAKSHAQDTLYQARFAPETSLSQRILLPEITDEAHGLEDARFVSFTPEDGPPEYRGCYVAFDGRVAAPG